MEIPALLVFEAVVDTGAMPGSLRGALNWKVLLAGKEIPTERAVDTGALPGSLRGALN